MLRIAIIVGTFAKYLSPQPSKNVIMMPNGIAISKLAPEFAMRALVLCCCILFTGCSVRAYHSDEAEPQTTAEDCKCDDCCSSVTRASMMQKKAKEQVQE